MEISDSLQNSIIQQDVQLPNTVVTYRKYQKGPAFRVTSVFSGSISYKDALLPALIQMLPDD